MLFFFKLLQKGEPQYMDYFLSVAATAMSTTTASGMFTTTQTPTVMPTDVLPTTSGIGKATEYVWQPSRDNYIIL